MYEKILKLTFDLSARLSLSMQYRCLQKLTSAVVFLIFTMQPINSFKPFPLLYAS